MSARTKKDREKFKVSMEQSQRSMRVKSLDELERLREHCDQGNYQNFRRVLECGGEVYFFRDEADLQNCTDDLRPEELRDLYQLYYQQMKPVWLYRAPKRRIKIPGLTQVGPDGRGGFYDAHGNYHSGGGSSHGGIH
ncbi:hypothetical protein HZA86_02250 [Candidatus Uhrbacteria bacterium]|nr:hypothetical protein [Candidatus Uhrbacteria bacterium]